MEDFKKYATTPFDIFASEWALVTAGSIDRFDGCTIGWGSFGNIWGSNGKTLPIITVYVHPARYTSEFLKENDLFTVSFFSQEYKKALAYMGSHSGRNEDKTVGAGLTPKEFSGSVTYEEANLTFLCKKLYQHQFAKDDLHPDVRAYYASNPRSFTDFQGGWQPHLSFIGQVIDAIDKR